jgi:1-acyl-sn-glycerol-3-phosphate acyltransferase
MITRAEEMAQKRKLSRSFAASMLRLGGWKMPLNLPPASKYVLIGAPHTSNWDFIYFLLLKFAADLELSWIGKASLFRWPAGLLMKRLGGIPVDRSSNNDFVTQIVASFNRLECLIVTIAPEGTRSKAAYWRTGFYYIALGAGVPISLGFIDYRTKEIGIGPYFYPSGNIQADFHQIKEFYASKKGKHPERQGTVRLLAEMREP